jgi:DNA polymerase III epsilon subunit-like protein
MDAFPHLTLLARRINRPISVFDLETTGLLNAEELGVAELALLTIYPTGEVERFQTLVQPDYDMPDDVAKLTGIQDHMLVDQPNFPVMWKQVRSAFENHAIFGFNSNRFDIQVLERQFERYGIQPPEVWRSYDVRTWHHTTTANHLNAEKGLRGNLSKIAVQWNVPIPDKLHRAAADVEVTAGIMEALLSEHGVSPLRDIRLRLNGKNTPDLIPPVEVATSEVEALLLEQRRPASEILSWVTAEMRINGYRPLSDWAEKLSLSTAHLEELMETSIDTKGLNAQDFRHEPTQRWIQKNNRLARLLTQVYPNTHDVGKLHYPHQALCTQLIQEQAKDVILDFVQLRVAMIDLKQPYVTRRNLLETEFSEAEHSRLDAMTGQRQLPIDAAPPSRAPRPRFS